MRPAYREFRHVTRYCYRAVGDGKVGNDRLVFAVFPEQRVCSFVIPFINVCPRSQVPVLPEYRTVTERCSPPLPAQVTAIRGFLSQSGAGLQAAQAQAPDEVQFEGLPERVKVLIQFVITGFPDAGGGAGASVSVEGLVQSQPGPATDRVVVAAAPALFAADIGAQHTGPALSRKVHGIAPARSG